MVNMYSIGMMSGMYGMNPMGGMSNGPSVNVHEQLKQRYGVGPEDFGTRPYAQPYPFPIIPRRPESPLEENAIYRFFRKCFS